MSLETVAARVDEIRTMLSPQAAVPAATPAPVQTAAAVPAFSDVLASTLDDGSTDDGTSSDNDFEPEIQASSAREGVDPALVRAIISHESGFDPNATSRVGAQGLMQLMPSTAAGLGVTNAYDPAQNIAGGTHLIRTLLDRYDGNLSLALAAYSAGPGAVDRFGGIPPYGETQAYVRDVTASYSSERNTG
jgi:soluble lytic murein transglycosylase-like protein